MEETKGEKSEGNKGREEQRVEEIKGEKSEGNKGREE